MLIFFMLKRLLSKSDFFFKKSGFYGSVLGTQIKNLFTLHFFCIICNFSQNICTFLCKILLSKMASLQVGCIVILPCLFTSGRKRCYKTGFLIAINQTYENFNQCDNVHIMVSRPLFSTYTELIQLKWISKFHCVNLF